jgi:hypothetical protein
MSTEIPSRMPEEVYGNFIWQTVIYRFRDRADIPVGAGRDV